MPQPYQLKNLADQGQYEQVVAFWADPNEVAQFSQWDFRDCMNSFYKLERYQECLEVYRACNKKYPSFRMLDNLMGWSIYYAKVKEFDFEKGDVKTLLSQIDYVFSHRNDKSNILCWVLAKFVAEANADGKLGIEKGYAVVSRYLSQVNPDTLNTQEREYTDENGKIRHLASDQEAWYSFQSKALLKISDYDACIACCDRGLQSFTRFHSNNDCWFRYRKAKCLHALGHGEEAKVYVKEILGRGVKHWCLLHLMYEFEAEAGNVTKALSFAGACALSDPEHKMRVSFYEELADYLIQQNMQELAMLHRKLVLLVREKNKWKEKSHHAEWQFNDEIVAMDTQSLLNRLVPVWHEWRDKDKTFLTGKVERLLSEGKSGFIMAEDGNSYYFNARDLHGKNREPHIGMRVRFTLAEKLDKSKGVIKLNAVEITAL